MRGWRYRAVPAIRSWIVAGLMCATSAPAAGDAGLRVGVAAIEGDGWRAGELHIGLRRGAAGQLSAEFTAGWIDLPAPIGRLIDIRGECHDLVLTEQRIHCGRLSLDPGDWPFALTGRLGYARHSAALDWRLETADGEAGRMAVSGQFSAAGWRVRLEGHDWPLTRFAPVAEQLGQAWPPLDGGVSFSVVAEGDAAARPAGAVAPLPSLVFRLSGAGLGGANAAGTLAAAGLDVELRGSAWPENDGLAFDARGAVTAGEFYAEPLYAELATHSLQASLRGTATDERVTIDTLVVEQDEVLHASAEAELRRKPGAAWQVQAGRLHLVEARLPAAYDIGLQPYLATTPLGDLETAGLLRGELTITDHALATLDLELVAVDLDDRAARLAIYDLSGTLAWARSAPDGSRGEGALDLEWEGGFLAGIPFGAAEVGLRGGENRWALASPVAIPVLGGALEIDTFEIADWLHGEPGILFDARLRPVDMRALSRVLDWPPLPGQLSGHLPGLSYRDGSMALEGAFRAELFGGTAEIRDLRAERIFASPSRLTAEIELRNLALAELTEVLSFGSMTGRVEGHVHGLELIDWRPVAFEARVQTPPGDRSPRRISQRAVDNIARLGGGGSGLSTGFLGLFEAFSYDAFALGCRLEGDVCEMSGLAPLENGYVILRGSGLPRIDVVGFARRVSWPTLVEQVAAIMASEGPEVR
ncbi:hypothetical protein [Wenzhouxiangella sp. XN24]|uniref:hypothetical protein n=1 Tax=Wenzhouxiangella sp. XN24 TaxID=2713569 RepID=UPI0013EBDAAE|nr:hypothetical protein [Wenzhouxiangella sp. XN24]NGX15565.1 hypothetical protein [Wenzhouxiangella sp. XN24]